MNNEIQDNSTTTTTEIEAAVFPPSFMLALGDLAQATVKEWLSKHDAPAEIVELCGRIGTLYQSASILTEIEEQIQRETVYEALNLMAALGAGFEFA